MTEQNMALKTAISVCRSVHGFGSAWNIFATIRWIAMKLGADIHVPFNVDRNNFGDPLTNAHLSNTLVYTQE